MSDADSARFVRARKARSNEIAEDYVELIGDLIARTGEARAADIARELGVKQSTVSNVLARLSRDGLVTALPYRSIFLTEKGEQLAEMARTRHGIVQNFLLALGVPRDIATIDAEGMEHHVSAETLAILERFTETLRQRL
jgi:DtxR family manganese transport transcriptional regulator